ncbi:MAG: GspE/PulE family protein [Candidatus Peregrinibacteria bacterium]|nr:GspE/PulE family protein [Candidatus Peregrinibacteria bacterium]
MRISEEALKKVLIGKDLLKEDKIELLKKQAKTEGKSLIDLMFEKEVISDIELGKLIAEINEVPFVKLSDINILETLLKIVPYAVASHQLIMPFKQTQGQIHIAMYEPENKEMINFLEQKTGQKIVTYFATKKDIKASLKIYNSDINKKFNDLLKRVLADPSKIESLKDAAKILDTVILFAYQNNSSDIHIEPQKTGLLVRYRIDGLLHTITELPHAVEELLIARIKVLAGMRTDEHRSPQDGRFKIDLDGNEITLRVSILPVYEGEKIVLRLLSSQKQELNLDVLGYTPKNLAIIKANIAKTHGMLLVTGPTGSGKTTTLYSILKLLNSPEVNISTIEDPIEYRLEGVNQIQVNAKTDLTFANGLRSILRQDPDIVMVGEIRDEETAGIAINAALTGHLVLATLHTNDAATTLPRLLEMGVEGFLVAATTNAIIAQRLVRKICAHCKEEYKVTRQVLKDMSTSARIKYDILEVFDKVVQENPELAVKKTPEEFILTKGKGCDHCGHTGFAGRLAIAEAIDITEGVKDLILNKGNATQIEQLAYKEGMIPMFIDGMIKVVRGTTTIEEVLRVMRE